MKPPSSPSRRAGRFLRQLPIHIEDNFTLQGPAGPIQFSYQPSGGTAANELIHKVWTCLPLDKNDSVRMPTGLLDLNALRPKDQRDCQFMGSLTTPPCTEGVL